MSNRRILGAVLLGFIIAVAIIAGTSYLQQFVISSLVQTTPVGPGLGILAVQLTDPLNLPSGVTSIYVAYSPIEVHAAGIAEDSGWYTVTNATTVDLTKIVAESTTLGSAQVTSGDFDLANLSITDVIVTFQDQNYTASVISKMITVPIADGGAVVEANSSTGFVIDFSPTVFKYQSASGLGFSLTASATSLPIPRHDWNANLAKAGAYERVNSTSWGAAISREEAESSFTITSASLTNSSVSITVKNTGNQVVNLTTLSILYPSGFPPPEPLYRPASTGVNSTTTTNSTSLSNSTTSATTNSTSSTVTNTTISSSSTTSTSTNTTSATSSSTTTDTIATTTSSYSSTSTSASTTVEAGLQPVAEFGVSSSGALVSSESLTAGYALSPGHSVTLTFKGSIELLQHAPSLLTVHAGQAYDFSLLADTGIAATYSYVVP